VEVLSSKAREIRLTRDTRSRKIERIRSFISDSKSGLFPLPSPLPLPLNAKISVTSITPDKSSVFKSNLFPLLLWFETTDPNPQPQDDEPPLLSLPPDYPIIFKHGDDLRQDQLVIQLFTLMDRLLRKENLDLRLSPYSVLATGVDVGMIQFVPSKSLAAIMAEFGSLQGYLRENHGDVGALGSFGIEQGVMDTFVRSCGGSWSTSRLVLADRA
jgi:phosphatidylinositol 3-kinase